MRSSVKLAFLVLAALSVFLIVAQNVRAQSFLPIPQNLEAEAYRCLTQVYPLDLSHYNVTAKACYTLPSAPTDTHMTQAVDYMLISADSNLTANFLFKDAALYSLSLRIINGTFIPDKQYANLTSEAADVMARYQAFSGVDSTGMIQLLSGFDDASNIQVPATSGGYTLRASHLVIPGAANGTTFDWTYTADGPDVAGTSTVALGFDKGMFYNLFDNRQINNVGSSEAMDTALSLAQTLPYTGPDGTNVTGFNPKRATATSAFGGSLRNGTAYPCWNVSVKFYPPWQGDPIVFQVQVWADTGEVFNHVVINQPAAISTVFAPFPSSSPEPSATSPPTAAPPSPTADPTTTVPEFPALVLLPLSGAAGAALAMTIVVRKNRDQEGRREEQQS